MSKEEKLLTKANVLGVEKNGYWLETIDGMTVFAYIGGRLRKHKIAITVGDIVTVELNSYDLTRGRITHRD